MAEVLMASDAKCSLSCASGEYPFIKAYGGTACECVPDVFNIYENESGDHFGDSVAVGDFNGDGFDDLAVGAPEEGSQIGVVYLLRGSPTGLRFWKRINQEAIQATNHYTGSTFTLASESGDLFGFSVAAGNFDNDAYDDLVIGAPGENSASGAVTVLRGSAGGLLLGAGQYIDQRTNGGATEAGDQHGYSLAVGRFNNDSYDDLAVGAPFETYGGQTAGVVAVLRGTSTKLVNDGGFLHQGMGGWNNETGDEFGFALAAGNLDSDSQDELVIGAPGENQDNGYVFTFENDGGWDDVASFSKSSSRLGESLAAGELYSGSKTLLVGAPGHGGGEGRVFLWKGSGSSLSYWTAIDGDGSNEAFGSGLALGPDGVIVSSPDHSGGGRVSLFTGNSSAVSFSKDVYQDDFYAAPDRAPGIPDSILPPEDLGAADFGRVLAFGDFNNRGSEELVVGAPEEEIRGNWGVGAIFVYTSDDGVSLEDSRIIDQSSMRYGRARID